jgi:hypothetical protein
MGLTERKGVKNKKGEEQIDGYKQGGHRKVTTGRTRPSTEFEMLYSLCHHGQIVETRQVMLSP